MFSKTLIISALSVTALLPSLATLATAATLPDAAQNGDRVRVRALLQQKTNVNAAQGDGTTALHWAAFNDDSELAKLLIAAGANVNATTRNGAITPLLMASRNGSAPMIELLLKAGADANSATVTGTTALMMAASSGSAEAVKSLIDHGANANAKDLTHGQTALMFAASLNRGDAIKVLMAHGADASLTSLVTKVEKVRFDPDGNVVLPDEPDKAAADKGATGQKADAKTATLNVEPAKPAEDPKPAGRGRGGRQAAATATADGKPAQGGQQQNQGRGDRGATSMGGQTALLYAARDGQIDAARALLDGGAKVNEVGEEKTTPIVMAIINGHFDVAKLLLDRGADPNLANIWGLAALYATIDVQWAPYAWFPQPLTTHEQITYTDLMRALLAKGADPNAKLGKKLWVRSFGDRSWVDPAGATPFWRAAQSDDVAGMHLLVAAGADPKIATTAGDTALMVAAGLGWAGNNTTTVPDSWKAAVQYCLDLGLDVNAVDSKGYTALHGVAFRGDNDLVKFLVAKGAKTDAKTKDGETIADMANGPIKHSILYPETVALLEKMGSANSHNCRSDQCIVSSEEKRGNRQRPDDKPKDDKKPAQAGVTAVATPAAAARPN